MRPLILLGIVLVSGALPASEAVAKAFASAALDISYIAWYLDDGDAQPDACGRHPQVGANCDRPLTAGPAGAGRDLVVATSFDNAVATQTLNGNASGVPPVPPRLNDVSTPLDVSQICLGSGCDPGAGIPYAENDFAPPASAVNDSQFAYADLLLDGYFIDIFAAGGGSLSSGGAVQGVRSDSSLPSRGTASGLQQLTSQGTFRVQGSPGSPPLRTYFEVDFVAQSIVSLSAEESVGSAALSLTQFSISVDGVPWQPAQLNLTETANNEPGTVRRSGDGLGRSLNSFDDRGRMFFELSPGSLNRLTVLAGATTNAVSNHVGAAPLPSTLLLVLSGLLLLRRAARQARSRLLGRS